jgi:hypothetical protein
MIVKYKEIWVSRNAILKEEGEKDLYFHHGQAEEKQNFCCHDLEVVERHLEYSIFDEDKRVTLQGHPDAYDCSYEYSISFCPFCGEKFEFESLGKYERIVKQVKTKKTVFDTKVEFKKIE